MPNERLIDDYILDLIRGEGPTLSRPYIEATILSETQFSPRHVTNALRRLHDQGRVRKTAISYTGSTGCEAVLYSFHHPSIQEIERFRNLFYRKHRLNNEIGATGELYFRRVLVAARTYRQIPQIRRMGHLQFGCYEVDLTATRPDSPEVGLVLFEVKNQRETFYPKSDIFGKLLNTCLYVGADQPALAVVHLSEEARRYCNLWGIAFLEFQRQLYPMNLRDEISAIFDVIGPNQFQFIDPERPFRHGYCSRAERDIEIVRDPQWLRTAHSVWRQRYNLAREYGYRLEYNSSTNLTREVLGRLQDAA